MRDGTRGRELDVTGLADELAGWPMQLNYERSGHHPGVLAHPERGCVDMETVAWRDFERLVSKIEQELGPQGAVITSPDYIPDRETGQPREVDASVRYKLGSADVLIILECRRRGRKPDIRWVEELHSKQQSVRAEKCIAVSSSGFTKSAVLKAAHFGIELRILGEIDSDEIKAWFSPGAWTYVFRPLSIQLYLSDPDKINKRNAVYGGRRLGDRPEKRANREIFSVYGAYDKFIYGYNGKPISPVDLFKDYVDRTCEEGKKTGDKFILLNVPIGLPVLFSIVGGSLGLTMTSPPLSVYGMCIEIILIDVRPINLQHVRSFSYASEREVFVTAGEFQLSVEGVLESSVAFYEKDDGEMSCFVIAKKEMTEEGLKTLDNIKERIRLSEQTEEE